MTAPVLMNESEADRQGSKIAMTAPVFMGTQSNQRVMSFVMPADFTMDNTPKPTNPNVWISEVTDYKVVAIRFSGRLSSRNAAKHTQRLNRWLQDNGYTPVSAPMSAAYNGPFTIPWFRRNEVLIEVI